MEDLIKEFRIAISNILLYPPDSAPIEKSLERCSDTLSKIVEKDKSLTIGESEGNLLINGKPIGVSGGIFLDSLTGLKIKSIIFKSGLTQAELYNLLGSLATKHLPQSSPHIEISEKSYIAVSKKDVVIEAGAELKERIIKITNQLSTLVDSIEDTEARAETKKEVAKILKLKIEKEEGIEVKKEEELSEAQKPRLELSPTEEAKEFLKTDSRFLLDEGTLQRVANLLQSLRSPKELELAGELCDKLASNLEASITDIRLKAVIAFKKLYSTIETLRDKNIVKSINLKLLTAGRTETDGQTYQEIAALLSEIANRLLKEGNYEDTHSITEMLSEHAKSTEFEERHIHAKATIDKLVRNEFTHLLVDDLSSEDERKREKAFVILLDIGEPCVPLLISKIKETIDLRLRKAIADLLVKIGDSAVNQLLQEFKDTSNFQSALRILDVLDGVGHEERVVDILRNQLGNPNFHLRRKVIDILHQIGTDSAKEAILSAIDDESHIIRERVIESLGNLRYTPAIPKLMQIIDKPGRVDKETVQEEACKALGNIGDPSAIPVLLKVASPKTLFYTGKSREIRIAAVRSLIKLGDPRAQKFIEDKDPFVSKTARELLKKEENGL